MRKFTEDYRGLNKNRMSHDEVYRGLPRTQQEPNEPIKPTVEVFRGLPRTQQEPNEPI